MAIFNFTFGKKKKQREQEEAMMDWYQELQNIQAFQGNVLGPAMQGTGVLPGIDSISAGLDSGGVPIDPNSEGVQGVSAGNGPTASYPAPLHYSGLWELPRNPDRH